MIGSAWYVLPMIAFFAITVLALRQRHLIRTSATMVIPVSSQMQGFLGLLTGGALFAAIGGAVALAFADHPAVRQSVASTIPNRSVLAYIIGFGVSGAICWGSLLWGRAISLGVSPRGLIFAGGLVPWQWVRSVDYVNVRAVRLTPAFGGVKGAIVRGIVLSALTHDVDEEVVLAMEALSARDPGGEGLGPRR